MLKESGDGVRVELHVDPLKRRKETVGRYGRITVKSMFGVLTDQKMLGGVNTSTNQKMGNTKPWQPPSLPQSSSKKSLAKKTSFLPQTPTTPGSIQGPPFSPFPNTPLPFPQQQFIPPNLLKRSTSQAPSTTSSYYNTYLKRLLSTPNSLIWSTTKQYHPANLQSSTSNSKRKRDLSVDSDQESNFESETNNSENSRSSDSDDDDDDRQEEEEVFSNTGRVMRGTRRTLGLEPVKASSTGNGYNYWVNFRNSGVPVSVINNNSQNLRKTKSILKKKPRLVGGKSDSSPKPVILIPIRLNLDLEGYKLRDVFMWNKNEADVTEEMFAELLCEDLNLPTGKFVGPISRCVKTQIMEYTSLIDAIASGDDEEGNAVTGGEKGKGKVVIPEDTRVIIRLDVNIARDTIKDQFEWDLCPKNPLTPEEFAETLVADLGKPREFVMLISHSIHEQLHRYRALWIQSHDPLKQLELGAALNTGLRWTPTMEQLTKPLATPESKDEIFEDSSDEEEEGGKEGEIDVEVENDSSVPGETEKVTIDGETEMVDVIAAPPVKKEVKIDPLGQLVKDVEFWGPECAAMTAQEFDRLVTEKERSARRGAKRDVRVSTISDSTFVVLDAPAGLSNTPRKR
ncbi:SWI SNF, matrix associated, actin dependent regulator of chromatin, sub b, member 1 [Nowakowskiella sp. JEL0407]|nr:SWI SNF, matrix associated, actin dependent regulator of chromatin, sub b, member 1 [Nowakowskiella sp. JEL0407]